MSHHLDTPLARQNGQLYIDDLYVYDANGRTVFAMDANSTITGPDITPGFSHEARYEFKVHFDEAGYEGLTYRVTFAEPAGDGRQALQLHVLSEEDARSDTAAGELVLEGRTGEVVDAGSVRIWAGRVEDAFYIDLSLLEKVNGAVRNGTLLDLSGWDPEHAQNSFDGTSVETIVIDVSQQEHPQLRPGARIGVWCRTQLATDAGGWRQINRAGHPMMWPIFWPDDVKFTHPANTSHPSEELDGPIGREIRDLVTGAVAANGTSDDPKGYGQTVAGRLFPDVLPYVIGTPATYSFAAFNGRTRADNAPEAMLSLVTCTAIPSGLKPSVTAASRSGEFPYVVPTETLVKTPS
ncbi:MAG: DUF4331 family protein [Solirubrobacteraceae bacterium]